MWEIEHKVYWENNFCAYATYFTYKNNLLKIPDLNEVILNPLYQI
jgi:hypothetical protein